MSVIQRCQLYHNPTHPSSSPIIITHQLKQMFVIREKCEWNRGTLFRAESDMSVNMPDISRKIKSDKQCLLWQFFVYHFSHFLGNCCQLSVCLPQTVQHICKHTFHCWCWDRDRDGAVWSSSKVITQIGIVRDECVLCALFHLYICLCVYILFYILWDVSCARGLSCFIYFLHVISDARFCAVIMFKRSDVKLRY